MRKLEPFMDHRKAHENIAFARKEDKFIILYCYTGSEIVILVEGFTDESLGFYRRL